MNLFDFLRHTVITFFVFAHIVNPATQQQANLPVVPSITTTVTPVPSTPPTSQLHSYRKPSPVVFKQPIVTPTPTTVYPTFFPTPIPSNLPTPTPSTLIHPEASIRGYYNDTAGDPTPLPGQNLTIKNLDNGKFFTISTSPFFYSPSLTEGRYEIIAAKIPGYNVSYSMCMDCTFHYSYDNGNVIDILLPNSPHYLDVIFRYTKQ